MTGNPSGTSDPLGRVTRSSYDASGNLSSFFDGQATRAFAFDANNRLTAVTDADGNATTLAYVQTACGCSEATLLASLHTPDLPANESWAMTYGPEGRLASTTDPDGHVESYAYEPTGEMRSVVDRLNNVTTLAHDQLGRVRSVVDALGRSQLRSYPVPTASGLAGAAMTAASASTTPASSDLTVPLHAGDYQIGGRAFDRTTIDFLSNISRTRGVPQIDFYRDATVQISYGTRFDDALRVQRREDRSGLPFADDTVLDQTGSGLSGAYAQKLFAWTPDLPDPTVTIVESDYPGHFDSSSFSYNNEYDVLQASGYRQAGQSVIEIDTRDVAGRVASLDRLYSYGRTSFQLPRTTYQYAPTSNRVVEVAHIDLTTARAVERRAMTYDERGLLRTITVTHIASGEGTYTFDYDALGRNKTLTYPDGHQRQQAYDAEGRMTSRCYSYGSAGPTRCYTATFDAAGNPVTMTDPEGTDVLGYDNLYRVVSVRRQVSGQADVVETYGYNAMGALNVNAPETTGNALVDSRPRLGGAGAGDTAPSAVIRSVNGAPVSLDPAGRLTSLNGAALGFDKQGLLGTVTAGSDVDLFFYDAQFRLVSHQPPPVRRTTGEAVSHE